MASQIKQTRPQPTVLELANVCLRRGDTWILQEINWQIPVGSTVAILGPNGSGKSTLARVLLGYLWPTSGEVTVLGERFGDTDLHELRKKVRHVQPGSAFDVDAKLNLTEVVVTGFASTLVLRHEPAESEMDKALDMLSAVGLRHLANRRYGHASSGERVRALIARALVTTPQLLILDEPSAGLDLVGRDHLLGMVESLRATTKTPDLAILTITHHTEELDTSTSDVLMLKQGRVFAVGQASDVLTSDRMSDLYDASIQVVQIMAATLPTFAKVMLKVFSTFRLRMKKPLASHDTRGYSSTPR